MSFGVLLMVKRSYKNHQVVNYIYSQEYAAIFAGAGTNPGEKTLEDRFFEKEVRHSIVCSVMFSFCHCV